MELNVKALSPKIGTEIPAPFYASAGAAAMDLHACVDQAVTIPAGGRAVIPTGIAIALPSAGYVALVFARSGLGIKHGIAPANCVGVIDSDYRGSDLLPQGGDDFKLWDPHLGQQLPPPGGLGSQDNGHENTSKFHELERGDSALHLGALRP